MSKNNLFNRIYANLVRQRHDELRASGKNPNLADVSEEIFRLDGLRLTESDVATFLTAPVTCGRLGTTKKGAGASSASRRAARASELADSEDSDRELHVDAMLAHGEARKMHLQCADYHDGLVQYHRAKSRGTQMDASANATNKCHCAKCGTDFDAGDGKLDNRNHYTCPECGAYLNKQTADNTEAQRQQVIAEQADAAKTCHCAKCDADFPAKDGNLDDKLHYTCPECGAYLEKGSAEMEDDETQAARQPAATPLCCARALPSLLGGGELANVICYMPGGIHEITPSQGGKPVTVVVEINEESAERIEAQRAALEAQGNRPFFSIQHSTQIAAFWPTKFFWDTRPGADGKMVAGVWVQGEWSQAGREAVEGKNFRSFSPTFFVDKISTDPENPAHVQSNPGAKLNMGALENDPAFTAIPPLWISQPQPRT